MKFEFINKYNGKDVKSIDQLPAVIDVKLQKLDKYFKENAFATIKIVKGLGERGETKVKIEVSVVQPGVTDVPLHAEALSDNAFDAIDTVLPKIERQIRKYKTRFAERKKQPIDLPIPAIIDTKTDLTEQTKFGKLVRTKNFTVNFCTVEEAIEDLELLGHDFYIFTNSADKKLSVLYKRRDGDYGLIVPE
ncbi:MAG: ribosome-associated translation inhibitor RaiA [Christensenellaceae bacterium]|jgi:putative sigma-54 modulation protein|nr:ribosome-associated translation inhibitor RaiA [Christensenellaceae bacterium]